MPGPESKSSGMRSGCFLAGSGVVLVLGFMRGPAQTMYDGSPLALFFSDLEDMRAQRLPEFFNVSWWYGSHVKRLCTLSIYTQFPEEPFLAPFTMHTMDDEVTPNERVEAYLQACQEVYESLPSDGLQRKLLDAVQPDPSLIGKNEGTMPIIHGQYMPGEKSTRAVQDREKVAAGRPDLDGHLKPMEEYLQVHPDAAELSRYGFHPVREETIRGSEVADAIVAGRVAVFDATELLPRGIFNKSLADMARMHGDAASSIPAYHDYGASKGKEHIESLKFYAERLDRLISSGEDPSNLFYYNRLTDMPNGGPFPLCRLPHNPFWYVANALSLGALHKLLCGVRESAHRVTINARRLTKLPPFDMQKALGSPEWLARVQNLLWAGPGAWNWHFDEDDNLLIALNGEMWAVVFTGQNDSDAILARMRMPEFSFSEARLTACMTRFFFNNAKNWWLKKYPFILVHLKPGMGITVPSKTVHTILTGDSSRILMNAFMIPKFKAPERITPDTWFREGTQTETYLALRSLKQASIGRLWDTRGIGGFFMGTKLEIL